MTLLRLLMTPFSRLLVASLATASCALPGQAPAETDFDQVGRAVATVLANRHFSRQRLDEEFDRRFVEHLLRQIDSQRVYLLQEDVDWIQEQFGNGLHERLLGGNTMAVAEPIYQRFQDRMIARHQWVEQRLDEGGFDLARPDAAHQLDRAEAAWPADIAAADDLWERRLTDELIRETLRRRLLEERRTEALAETEAGDPREPSEPAEDIESSEPGESDAAAGAADLPDEQPDLAEGADSEEQPAGEAVPLPIDNDLSPEETLRRRYHRIAEDIERLSSEDIADLFLSNLATSFDPHTDYMSFAEQQNFIQQMNGNLIGVGALLSAQDDGSTRIEGIVVGGPADKQGELQIDDRVIGVDPDNNGEMIDTMYMRIDRVVELIRGDLGTEVRLKIHPADAPDDVREIVIVRDEVELKDQLASAELYQFEREDGSQVRLGWINVPSFYASWDGGGESSVSRDVEALVRRLDSEGVDGLVLDLRANGGGVLDEAVSMTGLFIERGPVVQIAGHFGDSEVLQSFNREPVYDGPMAVVTSRLSASASEILAGALQDHNRAVIIGDKRTFGKGTVQRVIDVARHMPLFADRSRAGSLKVTEQKFYRPSGTSTQLDGVASDIVLPSVLSAYDIGEDAEQNPLPHDAIAQTNYDPWQRDQLFVEPLRELSAARIAESPEFGYVLEDIETTRTEQKRESVVLDLDTRYQQVRELEQRRLRRNEERRELFAGLAERDNQRLRAWRLTMENVDDPQLHPLTEFTDEDHMRRSEDEEDALLDTPEYPNGLDPLEREALAIVGDLVRLQAETRPEVAAAPEQPASASR